MEPKWIQDADSKGIQPKSLPQFEVSGIQLDGEYRKGAAQLLLKFVGVAFMVTLVLFIVWAIPHSRDFHQTSFSKITAAAETNTPSSKAQIKLKIIGWSKETKIPGSFFMTNEIKEGFKFVVVDIAVTNKSPSPYYLNIFSFAIRTDKDTKYITDPATNAHPRKLKNTTLSVDEEVQGILVFKVPNSAIIDGLELFGRNGSTSRVKL